MPHASRKEVEPLAISAYAGVALVAALARVLWWYAGVRFDVEPLFVYWQFLDPVQLASRPFEAILNLHAQPPALNTLAAVALVLPWPTAQVLLAVLFAVSGVAANVATFHVARAWSGRTWLALVVLLLSLASPGAILFENLLFTTQPVLVSLVLAVAALERFLSTGRLRWYALFGGLLLIVTSTRSMYGAGWMAVGLAIPFVVLPRRRPAVVLGLALLGASLLWPLKNGLLFGVWGSSSWMGMNFYNAVYNQSYTVPELEAFYAGAPLRSVRPSGSTSPIGEIKPFSQAESYLSFLEPRRTGIPVLDELRNANGTTNYNWLGFIAVSNEYRRDYLRVVYRDPRILVRVFRSSIGSFLRPASENATLLVTRTSAANLDAVRPVTALVPADLVLKLPGRPPVAIRPVSALLAALLLLCGAGLPILAVSGIRHGDRRGALALFVLWNVAYVSVVGNLFENFENMRFRLEVEPLMRIAVAALAGAASAAWQRSRA